ncbi:MAG: cyanophycin synthetase, partial [Patescibacteria group bacterium]
SFSYQENTYKLSCLGIHQARNAALCIDIARSLNVPIKAIQRGLASAKLPLRMEIVHKNPLIILDGAHNPDKMKTTVAAVKTITQENKKIKKQIRKSGLSVYPDITVHLILGFSENKNIAAMLRQLATLTPKTIACTRNTVNPFRKVYDPGDLQKQCQKYMPHAMANIFLDPADAVQWSKKQTKKGDVLLITGSIFLSGEIRQMFA